MAVALETIQIPKQLYLRLQQLANEENTELVSLMERLLDLAWAQRAGIGESRSHNCCSVSISSALDRSSKTSNSA